MSPVGVRRVKVGEMKEFDVKWVGTEERKYFIFVVITTDKGRRKEHNMRRPEELRIRPWWSSRGMFRTTRQKRREVNNEQGNNEVGQVGTHERSTRGGAYRLLHVRFEELLRQEGVLREGSVRMLLQGAVRRQEDERRKYFDDARGWH